MQAQEIAQKSDVSYFELNALLNMYDANGNLQLDKDKEAARQYFLQHVNQNTVFFHSIEEKLEYLFANDYYEKDVWDAYDNADIKALYKHAYSYKFRFPTFLGAYKYYTSYTLKTFDGSRYLERYEDRVVANALFLADGDIKEATCIVDEIISGRFQPATPTFLNAGKKQRGELVSCFLLRIEDNMESISRAVTSSLQLSKRGGGVALNLTNLREYGAPIKKIANQATGVIPVMKMLEDAFSYANQLGSRQGAGAVYLNAHHPDVLRFLDTKRENADEKIRIKTLSLGVIIPDITIELARKNEDMYLFSPYDVERVYGVAFSDISVTEKYQEMVANPDIRKTKINARKLFETIAEIQFESGYPYILFEDNANANSPHEGRVNMSNLCSEILQINSTSVYDSASNYVQVGNDISCNLASLNIANMMKTPDFGKSIETAVKSLSRVSETSDISSVPSIEKGNQETRAIGLGQMNLHGYLAEQKIHYGSEEGLDFTNMYFYTVLYHCLNASMNLARETESPYVGFETSKYATGEFFNKYTNDIWMPKTNKVATLFNDAGIRIPTREDWHTLKANVMRHGLYNKYLQAVPPTGSISYINNSTSSIHPVASAIEIRKEGKIGRVYYPQPGLTNDNLEYFKDAYEIGPEAIIDTYAEASQHVDQGLSLTLFFKDTATTRDVNKAQIYAHKKGIKTIYYIRIRQAALEGTEVQGCVSCTL